MSIQFPEAKTPWGPVGYITYKRTYSRRTESGSEEFPQTIDRCLAGIKSQIGCQLSEEEEAELRYYLLTLKGALAGRFMWQLGTETVEKHGLLSLQNCAVTCLDEPIKPFTWTFDALMLGCGVGYNLQREYVYQIPKVRGTKTPIVRWDVKDADFIVPDTREGWVELLRRTLEAYFFEGRGFSYSTMLVRGKGSPIHGFGGVASGAEELCAGIAAICNILDARQGKKIRPIDGLDIQNIIGSIVVAGNVRRSAQLAIGDQDDFQFLNAKRWDLGNIPNWRAMSNNSVACNDIATLPEHFWRGYQGNGEPYGLVNLALSRSCGRLGDTQYRDKEVVGYNPCGEQSLNQWETCCLSEVFLPNIKSESQLERLVTLLYKVNKHSLAMKCHHEDTESIVHKNMRMGIGIAGYLQATEEQRGWLKPTYEKLRNFDQEYSRTHGFNPSIKLTTVKPGGTTPLLPGVTSATSPAFDQYFIRRIQMASNSSLVELCKSHGYPVEFRKHFDGSDDHTTVVVSFPSSYPKGTVLAKDTTAIDQLEWIKRIQTEWSDNAVSSTVYYKKEELPAIREWLGAHYNKSIKTVSFLLHKDHGFAQAPFEGISEEEFERFSKRVTPITEAQFRETDILDADECSSGMCPVK